MQDLFYLTIPLYCSSPISVSIFLHIPMSFLPVFSPSALSNTRQQKCLSLNESACKWREWSVTSDAGCGRRHLFSYSQHWDSQCPKPAETWGVCIRCGCRSSEGAGKVNKTNSKVCAILKKTSFLKTVKLFFFTQQMVLGKPCWCGRETREIEWGVDEHMLGISSIQSLATRLTVAAALTKSCSFTASSQSIK